MSIIISDSDLLARAKQAGDVVESKDPDGKVLGRFSVEGLGKLPPGVKSPFTREEMEKRRREQRSGRPSRTFFATWSRGDELPCRLGAPV